LLLFAGLYEAWQPRSGEWQTTFTILTTAVNRLLEPIDNRMPVILDEAGAANWMNSREPDPLSLKRLLVQRILWAPSMSRAPTDRTSWKKR
jgi:putative SOS response-associated peptidase YedK